MTRMQMQSNAVLNALDEGKVQTVITLYESGWLSIEKTSSMYNDIKSVLQSLQMEDPNIDYWLEWFHIKHEWFKKL